MSRRTVSPHMFRRAFALAFVLGLTVASVAGVAIGVVAVVTLDRARLLLGETDWDGPDDEVVSP